MFQNKGSEVLECGGDAGVASLAFHPLARCLAVAVGDRLLLWDWGDQRQPLLSTATANAEERLRSATASRRA